MALVVLLRGVNVGGHRTVRPARLAEHLQHLDAVNIGAAGTFVIRAPVTRTRVHAEFASRLPFDAGIVICDGQELVRLLARRDFTQPRRRSDVVRFVSVLPRAPRSAPPLPMRLPERGRWLLKILARQDRFILGMYRRDMKVIGYLGALDRLFGAPATTRSWTTLCAIADVLSGSRTHATMNT